MLVSRHVYLTDTKTDRIDWNKGNNVCVCFLAYPSLNRWYMHNESFVLVRLYRVAYRLFVVIMKITCVYCTGNSHAVVYKHASFLKIYE